MMVAVSDYGRIYTIRKWYRTSSEIQVGTMNNEGMAVEPPLTLRLLRMGVGLKLYPTAKHTSMATMYVEYDVANTCIRSSHPTSDHHRWLPMWRSHR
jgi:hypothetical protein